MEEKVTFGKIVDVLYKSACDASDIVQDRNAEEYKLKKEIARRIRDLRQANRRTQNEVSEAINCELMTYRGYENIRNNVPLVYLIRLADLYNVSLDYLAGRTDDMQGKYVMETIEEPEKNKSDLEQRVTELEKAVQELKETISNKG